MGTTPWKAIATAVARSHNEHQHGLVRLDRAPVPEKRLAVNVTGDDDIMTVTGKTLHPIDVRRYLWNQRTKRAVKRPSAVVWSAYNEEDNTTYVGLGAITSPAVLKRLPASVAPLF